MRWVGVAGGMRRGRFGGAHRSVAGLLVAVLTGVTLVVAQSPARAATYAEQEGHNGVNTFTNYHNASGMGPRIAAGQWVNVNCKVYDPTIQSVNPDGYWYQIADSPWNGQYYSPANTFMNGDPWNGPYTHNTDFNVPDCGAAPPPPPPPPPPTPGWNVSGPHLKGDFEMGAPYELVFNVTNIGNATGTYTAGVTETGSTANGDTLAGTVTKSVTLAPGQSKNVIFLFSHHWSWIRQNKDGMYSTIKDAAGHGSDIKDMLQTVLGFSSKLGKLVGQYRGGKAAQIVFGTAGDTFSKAVSVAQWASVFNQIHQNPDMEHDFTYSPASMSSFNPVTVTLTVPAYKVDAFDYFITSNFKLLAANLFCDWFCKGPAAIGKIFMIIAGYFTGKAEADLYNAAWDPTSDYGTLPTVTDPSLAEVASLPAGELQNYAQTLLHGIGLNEAQSDGTVRYAGAVGDGAVPPELLQLTGEQDFSRQSLETMQADPIGRAMISDALSLTPTTTDQSNALSNIASNFDSSPFAEGMLDAGSAQSDLDAIQSIYSQFTAGDVIDLKSTLQQFDQALQAIQVDEDANADSVLSTTKGDAGLPASEVDLSSGPNYAGWYQTSPTITVSPAPGTAPIANFTYTIDNGPARTYSAPFQVSGDGNHLVTVQATGLDGTLESPAQTIPIRIDATPPGVQPVPAPAPNSNGWNNTPVSLGFLCTDVASGVASCPPSQTFNSEGALQSGSGTATDFADNSTTSTYNAVNIDLTPPTSAITAPSPPAFLSSNVYFTGVSHDALSGVGDVKVRFTPVLLGAPATISAQVRPGGAWGMSTKALAVGIYDVNAFAIDKAGNHQLAIPTPTRILVI